MNTRIFASINMIAATLIAGCASTESDPFAAIKAEGANVVSFKVDGMACRNCAREIAHELQEVPGVRLAVIDFDTATAKVALDADPAMAPELSELQAAVERWRREHFALPEDPECLDPARRAELQNAADQH